jgi:hypothetical protein
MTYVVQHLTNGAYGYPDGQQRYDVPPIALACVHITANSNTAANPDLHRAAQDERDYANRANSGGPSAHYYVARDGWAIEAIDPDKYAAWSNGDLKTPNLANPGIKAVATADGNPNEAYWLEFENVGYGSAYPVTVAQRNFMAERIAAMSIAKDMPISRATVHGHWEINGETRINCPSAGNGREAWLDDLVRRAQAEREELLIASLDAQIDTLTNANLELAAEIGTLDIKVADLAQQLAAAPGIERNRIAEAEAERIRGL